MTDAPLILQALKDERAEVKRLRDELDRQMEYIEWLEEFAPKAGEYNTSWCGQNRIQCILQASRGRKNE